MLAPMNLIRIDHVSLNAGDRARSIGFYQDVLGLSVSRTTSPPDQPVFLGPDRAQLGLFADRAPGLRHVALATDRAGQIGVAARLEALGVPFEPVRHSTHDSVYFSDPDGMVLEVIVPTA
jgi:catechol 2,3-dioxygenase-like lactoylglutathione lyase family enzyme